MSNKIKIICISSKINLTSYVWSSSEVAIDVAGFSHHFCDAAGGPPPLQSHLNSCCATLGLAPQSSASWVREDVQLQSLPPPLGPMQTFCHYRFAIALASILRVNNALTWSFLLERLEERDSPPWGGQCPILGRVGEGGHWGKMGYF